MRQLVACSVIIVFAIGCGGKKKDVGGAVSGTIKYKGQPVNGASLMVYSAKGDKSVPFPVSQEGEYHITDMPDGDYKLVVQPAPVMKEMSTKGMDPAKEAEAKARLAQLKTTPTIKFPDKYKKFETTDLKVTITKQQQTIDFDLKD